MARQQALDSLLGGACRSVLHLADAHELSPHVTPRVDHLHLVRVRVRVGVRVRVRIRVRSRGGGRGRYRVSS